MSRTQDIMNRIELAAVKFKMTIEEVVDILEGKHPALKVFETRTVINGMPGIEYRDGETQGQQQLNAGTAIQGAGTSATAAISTENPPISSGAAAASEGTQTQEDAGSTGSSSEQPPIPGIED